MRISSNCRYLLVCLLLAKLSFAKAGQITKATDYGDRGEMRTVIEAAAHGDTVTFAPGVHPVLSGKAINVSADGILIRGNLPATSITRTRPSDEPVFLMREGKGSGAVLENLSFLNMTTQVGDRETTGSGLVSVISTSSGQTVFSGSINNSIFDGNRVILGNFLHGGGLTGVYSENTSSSMGDINAVFSNNQVVLTNASQAPTGKIWGGGLVGAYAANQQFSASIGNISGVFFNNTVRTATYINGGGLAGAFVGIGPVSLAPHAARIGNIDADFIRNSVTTGTNLSGGGLIGSWAWLGDAFIGDVSGTFEGNTVTTESSYLRGGGLVGLRSYTGESVLGTVSASFLHNQVTVATSLGGGGIVGLYSANTLVGNRALDKTSTIGGMDGAQFVSNTVRVGSTGTRDVYALGTVVATSGLNQELVVNNTSFRNNQLYLTGQNVRDVGGTFYVGTDRASRNPRGHELTLSASDGMVTEFRGNSLHIAENRTHTTRFNSITFGREWDSATDTRLDSRANAQLNIAPGTGGRVLLLDPVRVDMTGGRIFSMHIRGPGYFLWAGRNEMYADASRLYFENGVTELAPDFEILGRGNLAVHIREGHTLRMNTTGRAGALPMFSGPDSFTVTGTPVLEGLYYGLDPVNDRRWLVTDRRSGVDADRFSLPRSALFDTALYADGDSLFLGIDNSRAILPFTHSPYRNVADAYHSGALIQPWNDGIARLDADRMDSAFDAARHNPRLLVGESLVSQGLVAMRSSRTIARQSLDAAHQSGFGTKNEDGPDRFRLWVNYIGSDSRQWENEETVGYDARFNGLVLGGTAFLGEIMHAGAYAAYAGSKTSYENVRASTDTDIAQTGVFATVSPLSALRFSADMYYAWLRNESWRDTPHGTNTARFNQHVFSAGLMAMYDFHAGQKLLLTPSAGLRYQHFRQAGFTESGTSLAHHLDSASANSLVGSLGMRLSRDFSTSERNTFTPAIHVSWNHELADNQLQARTRYAGYGRYFDISSGRQDRNSYEFGLGLHASLMETKNYRLLFTGGYGIQFSPDYRNQQFHAGLDLRF